MDASRLLRDQRYSTYRHSTKPSTGFGTHSSDIASCQVCALAFTTSVQTVFVTVTVTLSGILRAHEQYTILIDQDSRRNLTTVVAVLHLHR